MNTAPKPQRSVGNYVGNFIRSRREALSLSQRALGQLFTPTVTTQFISNIERGVTPLPPVHVATLAKALGVAENELLVLLEKEFASKLSGRAGRIDDPNAPAASGTTITVQPQDSAFINALYDAFRRTDDKGRQAFMTVCESMLGISRSSK